MLPWFVQIFCLFGEDSSAPEAKGSSRPSIQFNWVGGF
jgi:hypothetical protein